MNDEQRSKIQAIDLQELSKITPDNLEKDFLLDKAIEAVASIKIDNCRLVFGGGTSLSKCFCLTQRMSEDIDFKFAVNPYVPAKRTSEVCNTLRHEITTRLSKIGIHFDPEQRNKSKADFFRSYFTYSSEFKPTANVNNIQIECIKKTPLLPTQMLGVHSIADRLLGINEEHCQIECTNLAETFLDKLVAYLRRANASYVSKKGFDYKLMRHISDLAEIVSSKQLNLEDPLFASLLKEKIYADMQYHQATSSPAFIEKPFETMLTELKKLYANKELYQKWYDETLKNMRFNVSLSYEESIDILKEPLLELIEHAKNEGKPFYGFGMAYKPFVFEYNPQNADSYDWYDLSLCRAAISQASPKQTAKLLKKIPEECRTADICTTAVEKNPWALEFVPNELVNYQELCKLAIKINPKTASLIQVCPNNEQNAIDTMIELENMVTNLLMEGTLSADTLPKNNPLCKNAIANAANIKS